MTKLEKSASRDGKDLSTREIVRQVLCYELGYEPEDLADDTPVWEIGVDVIDLEFLVDSLEDVLAADFDRERWQTEMADETGLTLAALVAWCDQYRGRDPFAKDHFFAVEPH